MRMKEKNLLVRRAKPDDLPQIVRLSAMSAQHNRRFQKTVFSENVKVRTHVLDIGVALRSSRRAVFIAQNGSAIVGFISGSVAPPNEFLAYRRHGYVEDLYLIPSFRRKRVGLRLLSALIKWFRSKSVQGMIVWVNAKNLPAIRFWRKHMFGVVSLQMHGRLSHSK